MADNQPVDNPQPNEIVLEKYDGKGFAKSFLFGILLGLAIVIPGISGAAIAIIFHIYDKLLYAVSNILKKFKLCFLFLLPILLGFVIGFLGGFFAVQKLLDLIPFAMILNFAGLMIGAFPSVYKEVKGIHKDGKRISLMTIGVIIPIVIALITLYLSRATTFADPNNAGQAVPEGYYATQTFGETYPYWLYIVALPVGFVIGLTQVIPGLSATAFMMMIGWFTALVDTIHVSYIKDHPMILLVLVIMLIGALIGFFVTSKIMTKLFEKNRDLTYHWIVGLSAGSILTMAISQDIFRYGYVAWHWDIVDLGGLSQGHIIDISLAAPLLIIGFVIAFLLVRYMEKREASQTEKK
jgi:putative membrane protein